MWLIDSNKKIFSLLQLNNYHLASAVYLPWSVILMHGSLGGSTNAHSQSDRGVDATFGTASACGSA